MFRIGKDVGKGWFRNWRDAIAKCAKENHHGNSSTTWREQPVLLPCSYYCFLLSLVWSVMCCLPQCQGVHQLSTVNQEGEAWSTELGRAVPLPWLSISFVMTNSLCFSFLWYFLKTRSHGSASAALEPSVTLPWPPQWVGLQACITMPRWSFCSASGLAAHCC